MPALLTGHIARHGGHTAIADERGRATWRELGERVNRWASLLTGWGLRRGDRVCCVLGNRRESFEVLLACLHSGITVVPVNWHLTEPEIRYILADCGARAVIADEAHAAVAGAAASEGAAPVGFVLGHRDAGPLAAAEPALAAASPAEPAGQCCGSVMLYTSGTTGHPKGVDNGLFITGAPFSRVGRMAEYARAVLDVPAGERVLLDGPWYHSAQLFFSLLPLLRGSALIIRGRFDPATTLETIDREQITSAHLVPTQFVRLLRLPGAARQAFSGASLRRVWHGGGPCAPTVKRQMIDWWGPVFTEYYGATEGGAVTLINSADWLRHPGSVGRAVPGCEILVAGEDGSTLPPGQAGRVFIRRRTARTFTYHNAPGKTRAAHLSRDTFTFGELGYLDDAGYLFLTGRAQDLIVSGGVNVYPAEVEAVLLAHPLVRDAAVVGLPDDEFGERVAAIVECTPGPGQPQGQLRADLDRHCRRSLAGFKVPRDYRFLPALPREDTGKLRKAALWEAAQREPAQREPAQREPAQREPAQPGAAPAEAAR
jgi:acyl-CoA synthetase (AMP-forming)/AMP-acid ligase II